MFLTDWESLPFPDLTEPNIEKFISSAFSLSWDCATDYFYIWLWILLSNWSKLKELFPFSIFLVWLLTDWESLFSDLKEPNMEKFIYYPLFFIWAWAYEAYWILLLFLSSGLFYCDFLKTLELLLTDCELLLPIPDLIEPNIEKLTYSSLDWEFTADFWSSLFILCFYWSKWKESFALSFPLRLLLWTDYESLTLDLLKLSNCEKLIYSVAWFLVWDCDTDIF